MKGTASLFGTFATAPAPPPASLGRVLAIALAGLMIGSGAASATFFLVLGLAALLR